MSGLKTQMQTECPECGSQVSMTAYDQRALKQHDSSIGLSW